MEKITKPSGRLFVCQLILATVSVGVAQKPAPSIDAARLMQDLETLSSDAMEGRLAGSPGGAKARAYIVRRFKEAGIELIGKSYERPFTFRGRGSSKDSEGVNVVGVIPGQRDISRYILFTAHYDHLGVRNGEVFNGADDNASGVAVLLAVAARLSADKPDHSILFLATDAEEAGLQGARAFARDPPIAPNGIIMNVNVDMVARDAGNVLYAVGTSHYPYLKAFMKDVARPPVILRFGHDTPELKQNDWTEDSDHYPFHQMKVPFVYFGVEDEAQHHKATDDAATVTKEFFIGAANTILAAIRSFDANLDKIAAQPR
jgi:Zn-dependent M28 family amino/carboxypeptidase